MWANIVYGFLKALLEYFDKKLKEPSTIQNANTPEPIRRQWHNYLTDKLRNKDNSLK
jgi:hypothetical protein